jgi:hypothetical protein
MLLRLPAQGSANNYYQHSQKLFQDGNWFHLQSPPASSYI